jgi:hypothetical protein
MANRMDCTAGSFADFLAARTGDVSDIKRKSTMTIQLNAAEGTLDPAKRLPNMSIPITTYCPLPDRSGIFGTAMLHCGQDRPRV